MWSVLLLFALANAADPPCDGKNPFNPGFNVDNWCNPANPPYTTDGWPFCSGGAKAAQWMAVSPRFTIKNTQPYVCKEAGKVLRPDADVLICADYANPDFGEAAADDCTDRTCCAFGICDTFACPSGWESKTNPETIPCLMGDCDQYTCCTKTPVAGKALPKGFARGILFNDEDPGWYEFGGTATILRATDESDITHYRVYWAFSLQTRKIPRGSHNPVSWENIKWADRSKLITEVAATGGDISFTIATNTVPNERCPISFDLKDRLTAANDICNPHYWAVVAVNKWGENSVDKLSELNGPMYPITDYKFAEAPCIEAGITMGKDLPAPYDVDLGRRATSLSDCISLCNDHNVNKYTEGGSTPPCRIFNFAAITGGPTGGSCWIEAQTNQRSHYSVRNVGAVVCPTPSNTPATGKERKRCSRWIRHQNTAPFTNANVFAGKGWLWARFPQTGSDIHLGTPDNKPVTHPQQCQALCDLDAVCVGFAIAKTPKRSDKNDDPMLRNDGDIMRCILIHIDEGVREPSWQYDTWMCAREEMSPFVMGFDLQRLAFGYISCSGTPITEVVVDTHDCCATECMADSSCQAFTFWQDGSKKCQLFAAASKCNVKNKNVEGCAFESCYFGYGKATYKKQQPTYEIIDTWPNAGSESEGITVRIQTNGMFPKGTNFTCVAALNYMTQGAGVYFKDKNFFYSNEKSLVLSNTAEKLKTSTDYDADKVFTATLGDGPVTTVLIDKVISPTGVVDNGQIYDVKCAVENAAQLGTQTSTLTSIQVDTPKGFVWHARVYRSDGECWSKVDRNCGIDEPSGNGSVQKCADACTARGTDCEAFDYKQRTQECTVYPLVCGEFNPNVAFQNQPAKGQGVQCWRRSSNSEETLKRSSNPECTGRCSWEGRMGIYEKNLYVPNLPPSCLSAKPCDAMPCTSEQTCEDLSDVSYKCICKSDTTISAVDSQPMCTIDECDATPCAANQTCVDPDTTYNSRGDFTCTCNSDASLNRTGAAAICVKDECNPTPCGGDQTCSDPDSSPKSLKDFRCTCKNDSSISAVGTQPQCTLDECTTSPCGGDQDCSDPNTGYGSQHDYVCSCKSDPQITKINAPATCSKDECDVSPCDANQTCNDPNPAITSLSDFTCVCNSDTSIFATGAAATCSINECDQNPCPADQDCVDPNQAYTSQHDYVCTCKSDSSISAINGKATCSLNECDQQPCPSDQVCNDPTAAQSTMVGDYTCTCLNDSSVVAVGTAATCTIDECTTSVCPSDQTCNDPDVSYGSQHDYVCSCKSDPSITNKNAPAICSKDECLPSSPCGAAQVCSDQNTSVSSLGDYRCTCMSDSTVFTIGTAATCEVDECQIYSCGSDQTCNDPNTKFSSQHDFTCSCKSDASISMIDGNATCSIDECQANPCGTQQSCQDPDPSPNSLGNFVCTCDNDAATTATGGAVSRCEIDECIASTPCKTDQTCSDPDKRYSSQHDYVCTCISDTSINAINSQPSCSLDECASDPCDMDQTCNDPAMSPMSVSDFVCTCKLDTSISAVGTTATCSLDECSATSPPCGNDQMCNDPDQSRSKVFDYTCTCTNDASIVVIGSAAVCIVDECDADPCGGQTCVDANTQTKSTGDYTCSCPNNGPSQVGGIATCQSGSDDECLSSPCGIDQDCLDPNPVMSDKLDFICSCKTGSGTKTGTSATCTFDECGSSPCGTGQTCVDTIQTGQLRDFVCTCLLPETGTQTGAAASCEYDECATSGACGASQSCSDPMKTRNSVSDYTCTCQNGVSTRGGPAKCDTDECIGYDCGMGQSCLDTNTSATSRNNFVCSCNGNTSISRVNGPAICEIDECSSDPCGGSLQTCVDPNKSPSSRSDFTCSCTSNGQSATGGAALCDKDECTSNPCDTNQSCVDPAKDYKSQGDYVCTCNQNNSISAVGKSAQCELDECEGLPCGNQTCLDVNKNPMSKSDYTCTCDNGVVATGGMATCTSDECDSVPCGNNQTCDDPTKSYQSQSDFTCTCDNDTSISVIGHPASCYVNECDLAPCGSQLCSDPNTSPTSKGDFICSCLSNMNINSTGGAATCEVDECQQASAGANDTCGTGQTCNDPDVSSNSLYDFECVCDNDNGIKQIGNPAKCEIDECLLDPCHVNVTQQTCDDPNKSPKSLKDFTCTCPNDTTVSAMGGRALCTADECLSDPCDAGQTCSDPSKSYSSQHDYTCTCDNDPSIIQIDHAAKCELDECLNSLCLKDQTCNDPNTSFSSLKDFTCTCDNNVTASGGPAICTLDECKLDPFPCGIEEDQTCTDPNTAYTSQHDYICKCKNNSRELMNAPASCFADECFHNPCGDGQTCKDKSQDFDHIHDYECTCSNGKSSVGGSANCNIAAAGEKDECEGSPCGAEQHCSDIDFATSGNFICTCFNNGATSISKPANCFGKPGSEINECTRNTTHSACGHKSDQTCKDGNLTMLNDFECTCVSDEKVSEVGKPAEGCQRIEVDECTKNDTHSVCGHKKDQICRDVDLRMLNDYECTCMSDGGITKVGEAAKGCELYSQAVGEMEPPIGNDDDSSWWWIPVVIGSVLCLCAAIAFAVWKFTRQKRVSVSDFCNHMEMETPTASFSTNQYPDPNTTFGEQPSNLSTRITTV